MRKLICMIAFGAMLTAAHTAAATSFDCTRPKLLTYVEKMICDNSALGKLDDQLAQAYKSRFATSTNASALETDQSKWVRKRRDRCNDDACLIAAYNERLAVLNAPPPSAQSPDQKPSEPANLPKTTTAPDTPLASATLQTPVERHDDTTAVSQIADEIFRGLSFSGRIAVWPIDSGQARHANLARTTTAALGDSIRATIEQAGSAKSVSFVERDAISKIFQEQQFAQGAKESDFENLAHLANADAMIIIGVQRKDPSTIIISARLVSAKGASSGQLLSASKAYEFAAASAFNVRLAGVFDASDHSRKSQYEPAFESGLSGRPGLSMVHSDSDNAADFAAQASITVNVSDKTTQDAQGAQMFTGFLNGMMKQVGTDSGNPMGNIAGGMKSGLDQVGKFKVISVSISGEMRSILDNTVLATQTDGSTELPGGAPPDQIRSEAQNLVRKLLQDNGADLAAKAFGGPTSASDKKKPKGILD